MVKYLCGDNVVFLHPHLASPVEGEEMTSHRKKFPSLGGRGQGRGRD
jgi:hypothetical protein